MTTVTLQKNTTLSATVRNYNKAHGTHLTVAQVAKQNHIANANNVQAGQKIHIHDSFEAKRPTAPRTTSPSTAPSTVGAPCKQPNVVTQMMQDIQRKTDDTMRKFDPNYGKSFQLQPFKLK